MPVPVWVSRLPIISTPLVPDRAIPAPVLPVALVALILKFAGAVVLTVNCPGVAIVMFPPPL